MPNRVIINYILICIKKILLRIKGKQKNNVFKPLFPYYFTLSISENFKKEKCQKYQSFFSDSFKRNWEMNNDLTSSANN